MTAFEERPHSPYFGSMTAHPFSSCSTSTSDGPGTDNSSKHWSLPRGWHLSGLTATATATVTGMWSMNARTRKAAWRTNVGRIHGTPSATRTAVWRSSRARPAKSRDTSTTPRCAAPGCTDDLEGPCLAERLEAEAADLKRRFNRDFWIEEGQFFALALDGDKHQVDSLTSNIGHLLWSGIVEEDKIEACVRHLLGERLFSGWGVRTMAEGDAGYNPIGYHVGTVWPHDNSLIAWGLRRCGYRSGATGAGNA